MQLGQPARLTLDAFGTREFVGIVSRIAPFVVDLTAQARTVEIEVELMDPTDIEELLAGYSADVEIILETRNASIRVPSESVLENRNVFVISDGIIEKRKVSIGLSNWGWTEIIEGISSGESVITSVDVVGLIDGALARIDSSNQ